MAEKASCPIPAGMHTITPHFWFNGNCREAIAFYQKALNAELVGGIIPSPDGKTVWHATLKIADSMIMLADTKPGGWEKGPTENSTMGIFMYVEDCDKAFNQAISSGAEVIGPLMDMFWGDRCGKFKDPYGHAWVVATHQWNYTPEEMKAKEDEMMANMKAQ